MKRQGDQTGFTETVRILLRSEGPKTPRQVKESCNYLLDTSPSHTLKQAKDIHYLGCPRSGIYYLSGQRRQAQEMLKKIRTEYKERRREKNITLKKKRQQKLFIPPNPEVRTSLDLFPDDKTELTEKDIWLKMGGYFPNVVKGVRSLLKSDLLILVEYNPERKYRMNPEWSALFGENYENAQKEMFGPTQ